MFLYYSFAMERRIFQIHFADGLATTLPLASGSGINKGIEGLFVHPDGPTSEVDMEVSRRPSSLCNRLLPGREL
jgi:hypothetical protein